MAEAAEPLPDTATLAAPGGAPAADPNAAPVVLHDRYRIFPGKPLPELDSPSAKAYAVEDRREPSRQAFALICSPDLPPRLRILEALHGNPIPGMVTMLDYGAADWPPLQRHCMAIVFEKPAGQRLSQTPFGADGRLREHDVARILVEPVARALVRLSARGLTHRAIRPNNMFLLDAQPREVVLGECVTAPAGYDQPMVFESIERGMAGPAGRGEGYLHDDLYALGASIAFLMMRRNPVEDHSPERIRQAKIERGSYAAICGNERLPMQLIEPARGLLMDVVEDRWTLEDVQMWVNGARRAIAPRKGTAKAENGFLFAGREHHSPRTLAHAFSQSIAEAAAVIRDGRLEGWLRRHLMNTDLADETAAAVEVARAHQGSPSGTDEYVVAKICIMLDPGAPIRYRGFSFMPDGFGSALAVEFLQNQTVQVPAEALTREIPALWFAAQAKSRFSPTLERSFTTLRGILQNVEIGFGIERCLYESNPGLPCQSPLVASRHATTPEQLMTALEAVSQEIDAATRPMDRHIAAFLVSRFEGDTAATLRSLGSSDDRIAALAMLHLYATVQQTLQLEQLHGFATWMGEHLGPAINTYRNRNTRRALEKEVPRMVRLGDLPQLLDLVDNPQKRAEDDEGFAQAQAKYAAAENEIAAIQNSDSAQQETAEAVGQQTTAMGSVMLTFIVVGIIYMTMSW